MNDTKPRIIAFVSDKGGSGKTTVTIAIAKLLADMGHPCLLIDFDLATNGGSYFFKKQFKRESKGIWESLRKKDSDTESSSQMPDTVITISNDFDFVPSRTNLNTKGESYDSFSFDREYLEKQILSPLVNYATQKGFHYVLIDCQAGYSISATAAVEGADMAIIVTEADSISSDASDNLLIQLGSSLPDERRYLVNKIDVRDADTYRNMRNVFQSLNRPPPLPFDFNVRNAFGARQIPIDLNNPSPLLFALFETLKYMFTEIFEDIDSYKRKHVDSLFEEYDQKLQGLLEGKKKIEEEQVAIKTRGLRLRYDLIRKTVLVVTAVVTVLIASYVMTKTIFYESYYAREIFDSTLAISLLLVVLLMLVYSSRITRQYQKRAEDEMVAGELSYRLESINREIDQFRSLLWARSRDFLVDAEITGENKRNILGKKSNASFRKEDTVESKEK